MFCTFIRAFYICVSGFPKNGNSEDLLPISILTRCNIVVLYCFADVCVEMEIEVTRQAVGEGKYFTWVSHKQAFVIVKIKLFP